MTDSSKVAVVHDPECTDHATRLLAVADALEAAGADIAFAAADSLATLKGAETRSYSASPTTGAGSRRGT